MLALLGKPPQTLHWKVTGIVTMATCFQPLNVKKLHASEKTESTIASILKHYRKALLVRGSKAS